MSQEPLDTIKVYASLLEALPVPAFLANPSYTILHANPALKKLLGNDHLANSICFESLFQDDSPCKECGQPELLSKESDSFTKSFNINGVQYDATHSTIHAPDGQAYILVVLETNTSHLIHYVTETRKDIHDKTHFYASLNHEIRTPLNAIIGMSELLASSPDLPERQKQQAEMIRQGSAILLNLINNFLDITKIQSGCVTLEKETFSLEHLLLECMDLFTSQASFKQIQLWQSISPALVKKSYISDAPRIKQILVNLLSNAIKFTDSGSVCINVRPLDSDEKGGKVRIRFSVEDTGPGVPPEEAPYLFEPFQQGKISRLSHYAGTGLGLSLSQELCSLMGGSIGYEENSTGGSIFHFELPLEEAPVSKTPPKKSISTNSDFSVQHPFKILIVDDNASNRKMLSHFLRQLGYEPLEAESVNESYHLLQEAEINLIFLDLRMPGEDGTTLLKKFQSKESAPHIIVLTASPHPGENQKCLKMGAKAFLTKPFSLAVLQQTIENLPQVPGRGFKI